MTKDRAGTGIRRRLLIAVAATFGASLS
ncbi:MAG: hypothetical protein JWO31_1442, partial [Phycisphaerales bacterium]|nr:hypothetical protein [Phycisphaerales bacterium]